MIKFISHYTTYYNVKVLATTFKTEASAEAACKVPVSTENLEHFVGINQIAVNPLLTGDSYAVKLIDVPLDVDKHMFETFLKNKIDDFNFIRYQLRDLYFHVYLVFKSNKAKNFFNNK